MNKKMKMWTLALSVLAILPSTGCVNWDSLLLNIWNGFGLSIGGVPGQLIGDLIFGALGL